MAGVEQELVERNCQRYFSTINNGLESRLSSEPHVVFVRKKANPPSESQEKSVEVIVSSQYDELEPETPQAQHGINIDKWLAVKLGSALSQNHHGFPPKAA